MNKSNINFHSLTFGLISVFLIGLSFSIVMPVIPFLVEPYVSGPKQQAFAVTSLTSIYALCTFFAAPILGSMSDKYGRRPILLLSLLGASLGFFIFGLGGALWILFLGRIIEGITGGSISTIFAYFADITPSDQRTKYFGWVSAITGLGTIIGPSLGGFLSSMFGYQAPMFFGASLALVNAIYGYFFMPESHKSIDKSSKISFNPIQQLRDILSIRSLQRILFAASLLWISSTSLQGIFTQFSIDTFNWQPKAIGLVFSIMGLQDILSQAFVMPQLLKHFRDKEISSIGMISEVIGYILIACSAFFNFYPLLIAGMFIYGFGDSIFGPSFNGIVSKSVSANEQGRVQGGVQSIQALTKIAGPLIGGQMYILFSHAGPALLGAILLTLAVLVLNKSHVNSEN